MKTIYLRYTSQDEGYTALQSILGWAADEEGYRGTTGEHNGIRYDVDDIGTMYAPVPDDAPEDYAPEPLPGYHVNVLWWGEDAPDFGAADLAPDPTTPSRVFATGF